MHSTNADNSIQKIKQTKSVSSYCIGHCFQCVKRTRVNCVGNQTHDENMLYSIGPRSNVPYLGM